MLGVMLLIAAAIGAGFVALRPWGVPEWPQQLLAAITVLNVAALVVIAMRRTWSRRVVMVLLGTQLVVVDAVLIVAAVILIRDNPGSASGSYLLVPFLFLPGAVANTVVALVAARSINGIAWLKR